MHVSNIIYSIIFGSFNILLNLFIILKSNKYLLLQRHIQIPRSKFIWNMSLNNFFEMYSNIRINIFLNYFESLRELLLF